MLKPRLSLVGKPVRATPDELGRNPRARSAVMRVARKIVPESRTQIRWIIKMGQFQSINKLSIILLVLVIFSALAVVTVRHE